MAEPPMAPVNSNNQPSVGAHLNGKQKAAILMLAVGREKSARILKMLHEDEIRDISVTMAGLG
ncbi:MAG: flagellar motor switch protein FliG, partial [Komagataeibacter saccharivorans]